MLGPEQKPLPFQTTGVDVVQRATFNRIEWSGGEEPPENAFIIVSMPVGEFLVAHPELSKWYVFGPDTGPAACVRDGAGKIIGTKRLVFYAKPASVGYDCVICTHTNAPVGYCQSCGTDIVDEAVHIADTIIWVRKRALLRLPKDAPTPPE